MNILKINAVDKMVIPQFFPQQESIIIQMMARDIGRKIEITDKDREIIDLKTNPAGPGIVWNHEKVKETEIEVEFTEAEINMLQERVSQLDNQKKITPVMLDTCVKIRDAEKATKE